MSSQVEFLTIAAVTELPLDLSELTVKDIVDIAEQLENSPVEVFEAIINELEAAGQLTSDELSR